MFKMSNVENKSNHRNQINAVVFMLTTVGFDLDCLMQLCYINRLHSYTNKLLNKLLSDLTIKKGLKSLES